jgi:hypothetical protein
MRFISAREELCRQRSWPKQLGFEVCFDPVLYAEPAIILQIETHPEGVFFDFQLTVLSPICEAR